MASKAVTTYSDGQEWAFVGLNTCEVEFVEFNTKLMVSFTHLSCGHIGYGTADWYNYCPKCGAKVVKR